MKRWTTYKGFTIVELLVVITVIAILASIVIVNYNGVRNKANDSSIQSDLDGTAGLIESFRVSSSSAHQFPRNKTPDLDSLNVKVAKNAYDTSTTVNFVYCVDNTDFQSYALVALSKSGNVYMMTQDGFKTTTIVKSDFSSSSNVCTKTVIAPNLVSGGMYAPNTWQTWVGSA